MERTKSAHYFLASLLSAASLLLGSQFACPAAKPSYDSKMQLGQLLQFNGNIEQAIKAYKYAASLKPNAFDPHFALVNIYAQQQDFPAAAEECREALKIKPKSRDLHLVLGNLYRTIAASSADPAEQKKLVTDAIKELEEAENLGADKALIHSTLSVLHVQNGDFDKALEHVDVALDVKDNLPDAHLIRAVLKFKKGEKDVAMKELDIAIQQKKKNAEARNTKADILFGDGKVDEALAEYRRALEDDPNYYQAMVGISNILIQKQQWDEALKILEKAQEIRKSDANIIYSIAICLEKSGRVELAIPKFHEGILVDNNQTTKAQILGHVSELQQRQLFSVPGIMTPGASTMGPNAPGAGLFGPGSSFLTEPFKDLIKIKAPGDDKEEKSDKKKNEKKAESK